MTVQVSLLSDTPTQCRHRNVPHTPWAIIYQVLSLTAGTATRLTQIKAQIRVLHQGHTRLPLNHLGGRRTLMCEPHFDLVFDLSDRSAPLIFLNFGFWCHINYWLKPLLFSLYPFMIDIKLISPLNMLLLLHMIKFYCSHVSFFVGYFDLCHAGTVPVFNPHTLFTHICTLSCSCGCFFF